MTISTLVFAYHNVGVRCLSALLDRGVQIALVVTHEDNPGENIWFDSVACLAALHNIPVITPQDPNAQDIVEHIAALQPDFFFSFYYRLMLKPALLALAKRGAYNMHGSLLPKYRGRAPINWAILKGETETGATLHEMVEKPDAGRIVDLQAVPILADDTARQVFDKVAVAAEMVLHRTLPDLISGRARLMAQDLRQGGYFSGRTAADGVIDWRDSARNIHNLVRAVAPPYPGASTSVAGNPARVLRTLREPARSPRGGSPVLYQDSGELYADCGDGGVLRIVQLEVDGCSVSATDFRRRFGPTVQLG